VTQAMQQQIVTLQQKTEETQQQIAILEQLDTVIYPLKGTENAPLSQGRLIVNPTQQTAVIMTQQLPELPTGQAYRLWAMPVGATQPLYCGQFQRHPTESATRWTLPASACSHNVAQMLISAESTSAPLQPAGPLMMKSLI
jgi:Anti-sigma-K factor rskA